jgi:hypothetical protein
MIKQGEKIIQRLIGISICGSKVYKVLIITEGSIQSAYSFGNKSAFFISEAVVNCSHHIPALQQDALRHQGVHSDSAFLRSTPCDEINLYPLCRQLGDTLRKALSGAYWGPTATKAFLKRGDSCVAPAQLLRQSLQRL